MKVNKKKIKLIINSEKTNNKIIKIYKIIILIIIIMII